ncbi:hypothetical protein [Nocardia harenae]|uniref:hypothetical protein n=1 Tax=Nocardia harenae TaxID=358707 RepID=UPI000835E0AE|nr:hypothetical protein [Nocardia harenae]
MSQLIDWQVYYEAAQKCHDLAGEIRRADAPLHAVLQNDCSGMAGDAPGCREWGNDYDALSTSTLQTCTNMADALSNLGYVIAAFGYNHGINNRSNPAPARPAVGELEQHRVALPSAVGDNGLGTSRDDADSEGLFDLFADKIIEAFGKLPNGNVSDLSKAKDGWEKFAANTTITGAPAQIAAIKAMFDTMQDPNLDPILRHFDSLHSASTQLASTSMELSKRVTAFRDGTEKIRDQISTDVTTAAAAIAATVVIGVATAFFTFGASAVAASGGTVALIANAVNAIRTAYVSTRWLELVGLSAATATAYVTLSAFDGIPSLTEVGSGLASIIAMRVYLDDETDAGDESASGKPVPATGPTNRDEVQDILLDRTDRGRSKPHRQMETEAEIRQLYDDLTVNGEPVTGSNAPGERSRLSDGTEIALRESSTSGGVTIEIKYPGGQIRKVHLP